MSDDLETKASYRASIAAVARREFAEHVLVEERPGVWRCARPGTGIYAFRVAELPGAIAVWGDIGGMLIDAGAGYTVAWLRGGAVRSRDYVLEKARREQRTHYCPGHFRDYLATGFGHDGEQPHRRFAEFAEDDFDELAFRRYLEDGGDCEINPYDYASDAHWSCEALLRFVELLEDRDAVVAP